MSRNITSHKEKGIGAWSDDEIKRAITKGVRKDGSQLKPPMGYAFYANMTDGRSRRDRGLSAHRAGEGVISERRRVAGSPSCRAHL